MRKTKISKFKFIYVGDESPKEKSLSEEREKMAYKRIFAALTRDSNNVTIKLMGEASYSKRPMWQWIVIYLVVGLVIYGVVYYFVFAKKGGYNSNNGYSPQAPSVTQQVNPPPVTVPAIKNSVQISNFSFSPVTLTIKVGDTVTWTNQDSMGHSATADDKSFDTGVLNQGKSGTITFSKAGTYPYHCSVHPSMHGTIVVQ